MKCDFATPPIKIWTLSYHLNRDCFKTCSGQKDWSKQEARADLKIACVLSLPPGCLQSPDAM